MLSEWSEAPIELLTDDALRHVFHQLDAASVAAACHVSTHWARVASEDSVWRALYLQGSRLGSFQRDELPFLSRIISGVSPWLTQDLIPRPNEVDATEITTHVRWRLPNWRQALVQRHIVPRSVLCVDYGRGYGKFGIAAGMNGKAEPNYIQVCEPGSETTVRRLLQDAVRRTPQLRSPVAAVVAVPFATSSARREPERREFQRMARWQARQLRIQYLSLVDAPTLALFGQGLSTGIVVSIGFGATTVAPVVKGAVVRAAVRHGPIGGAALTRLLAELLSAREDIDWAKISASPRPAITLVRDLKEQACEVSSTPLRHRLDGSSPYDVLSLLNRNDQPTRTATLEGGHELVMGWERLACAEVLFDADDSPLPSQPLPSLILASMRTAVSAYCSSHRVRLVDRAAKQAAAAFIAEATSAGPIPTLPTAAHRSTRRYEDSGQPSPSHGTPTASRDPAVEVPAFAKAMIVYITFTPFVIAFVALVVEANENNGDGSTYSLHAICATGLACLALPMAASLFFREKSGEELANSTHIEASAAAAAAAARMAAAPTPAVLPTPMGESSVGFNARTNAISSTAFAANLYPATIRSAAAPAAPTPRILHAGPCTTSPSMPAAAAATSRLEDQRLAEELLSHVVLTGGTASMPGLAQRLAFELGEAMRAHRKEKEARDAVTNANNGVSSLDMSSGHQPQVYSVDGQVYPALPLSHEISKTASAFTSLPDAVTPRQSSLPPSTPLGSCNRGDDAIWRGAAVLAGSCGFHTLWCEDLHACYKPSLRPKLHSSTNPPHRSTPWWLDFMGLPGLFPPAAWTGMAQGQVEVTLRRHAENAMPTVLLFLVVTAVFLLLVGLSLVVL